MSAHSRGLPLRGPLLWVVLVALAATGANAQLQWTQRHPAAIPWDVDYHNAAYDAVRRRVVLYAESWNMPPSPPPQPPPAPPPPTLLWGTVEWDGFGWQWRKSRLSGQALYGNNLAMTYDAVRREIVLFGGAGPAMFNYTWVYRGTTWQRVYPKTSPPARAGHAMAYDAARRRVVLFGGQDRWGARNDTWEWDGSNWTQRITVMSPPSRYDHAMAFDAARGRLVLFGGFGGACFDDTWVWLANTWIRKPTTLMPRACRGHAMAYDSRRQRIVLFGGHDGLQSLGHHWEWDGSAWAQRVMSVQPPARAFAAMAYHAAAQRMVLYGGRWGGGMPWSGRPRWDCWELGETCLTWTSGTPRVGGTVTFSLASARDAGRRYQLASSMGSGPLPLGPWSLGLSPDALLALSVSGALPAVFRGYQGVLDANGRAAAALAIPSSRALVGYPVVTAFVTLDPQSAKPVRSVSDSVQFQILP